MGACCSCSKNKKKERLMEKEEEEESVEEVDVIWEGDNGHHVSLLGPSKFTSMFTQRGEKGVNQDAMTIWEGFAGEEDQIFCGVFDGHGPCGHRVALQVRDVLPLKLSSLLNGSNHNDNESATDEEGDDNHSEPDYSVDNIDPDDDFHPTFSVWKTSFIKAFKETDKEFSLDSTIESFISGTTAVTVLKQGEHLLIANLGDSRAVLCSRDNKNQPFPIQLTVDLKPDIPSEAARIESCKGRVLATEPEPNVFRVWMPDVNCPGLAMSRAFGDFCLKDFGLISVPQVSYRRLTSRDEFVVLATDGVWDVLSNDEVVKIVASARKRSMAAKLLVDHAVDAWRIKYPTSRTDDCAVICLFMKQLPSSTSLSSCSSDAFKDKANLKEFTISRSAKTIRRSHEVSETGGAASPASTNLSIFEGFNKLNSKVNLHRPISYHH